jgi:asparagine synthase (glutamine-hydrolysing)
MDEPHADSALAAVHRVSELASHRVKVILNGTGGDELFGGYGRYCPSSTRLRAWHAVPGLLKDGLIPVLKLMGGEFASKVAANCRPDDTYVWGMRQFTPFQLANFFGDGTALKFRDPLIDSVLAMTRSAGPNRFMYLDANLYLVDDLLLLLDKMTMAASIEGRVPLLDHRLVEWAFRLPSGCKIHGRETKYELKRWLKDVLPAEVLERRKQGFGAPVRQWMDQGMFFAAARLISGRPPTRASYYWGLRGADLEARMRSLNFQQSYALLVLEIWLRVTVDGLAPSEVTKKLEESVAPTRGAR